MSEIVEFVEEKAGIYFRSILIPQEGTWVPQHTHSESHATFCGQGAAAVYVGGEYVARLEAGHAFEVEGGKDHAFRALMNNTRLTCVWDAERAMRLKERGF